MLENSHADVQNKHVVELIAKSLDEPLTQRERAQVNAHLKECITCRIASDGLYEFDALMKRTMFAAPDEGFTLRVLRRLEVYERRRSRWEWLITLLLLLIGALSAATWLILNLGQILNSVGVLFNTFFSIAPVWFNALFVLSNHLGSGPLLVYALIVLALTYLWVRACGGLAPLQLSN